MDNNSLVGRDITQDFTSSNEVMFNYMLKLDDIKDVLNYCSINRAARKICQDDYFWKKKYEQDYGKYKTNSNLKWIDRYKFLHLVLAGNTISAGLDHYGQIQGGTLFMTGNNNFGQLGDGTTEPAKNDFTSPDLSEIKSVSCGDFFTLALGKDGKVYFWGRYDDLGLDFSNRPELEGYETSPVELLYDKPVIKIKAGHQSIIIIYNDYTVNVTGEGISNHLVPQKLSDLRVVDFSVGQDGYAYVTTEGTVYVGGNYTQVQGGIAQINLPDPIKQICLGSHHLVALSVMGNVYTWGINSYGCLGDGGPSRIDNPQRLPTLSNIVSIDAKYYTNGAVGQDGKLFMWGQNNGGQITNKNRLFNLVASKPTSFEMVDGYVAVKYPTEVKPKSQGDAPGYVSIGHSFSITGDKNGIIELKGSVE